MEFDHNDYNKIADIAHNIIVNKPRSPYMRDRVYISHCWTEAVIIYLRLLGVKVEFKDNND